MVCKNDKKVSTHSPLCKINYTHSRTGPTDIRASHFSDCTLGGKQVAMKDINQTVGYEASMTLVSREELDSLMSKDAKFGTYCWVGTRRLKTTHFCVDEGRRTVDGRRLAWLWVFPDGKVKPAHKVMSDPPTTIWTKQQVLAAWDHANNETLPAWTRHVDQFSELAITFCLPPP